MKWLIVLGGIACNASASVLVKIAVMRSHTAPLLRNPLRIFTNLPLLAGVALYGAAFVLYAATLSLLPLNVAQPVITSGAIATVAIISVALFGESMPWTSIVGILLVVVGVALIARRVS